MIEKKYLVVPGHVTSQNDGDVHYIGAWQLIRLYGVKREECVIWMEGGARPEGVNMPDSLIVLKPRDDGNYERPKENV